MNDQKNEVPDDFTIENINVIELLGAFCCAARAFGWTGARLGEVLMEAMSGDNKHLHRTLAKYC
jgi:hypothetical protein